MREGFSRFTHHVSRLLDLFECFGPGTAASTAAVAFFDGGHDLLCPAAGVAHHCVYNGYILYFAVGAPVVAAAAVGAAILGHVMAKKEVARHQNGRQNDAQPIVKGHVWFGIFNHGWDGWNGFLRILFSSSVLIRIIRLICD
jgi:hypothetical protein